ncbi:hypothetical protein FGRMN_10332 [Fusarium graminum]|nr:hypothetical protein FGRMN_10332 [Fusarium graminum]
MSSDVGLACRFTILFENGIDVQIVRHDVCKFRSTVYLLIEWRDPIGGLHNASRYEEAEIQDMNPGLVYNYWEKQGGHCKATCLELFHVFAIVAESRGKYLVQWVGYDMSQCTWESTKKVNDICPHAVIDWRGSRIP